MTSQPASSCPRWRSAATPAALAVSQRRAGTIGLALLSATLLVGCSEGIRWRAFTYPDAAAAARADRKLTFVYFRSWYSVECTHFEEEVLKNRAVLAETQSMVCVPLDFDHDRMLAPQSLTRQWGLQKVPAFAIVTPEGQVLEQAEAPITLSGLLDAIRAAKAKSAGSTQPAPPPGLP